MKHRLPGRRRDLDLDRRMQELEAIRLYQLPQPEIVLLQHQPAAGAPETCSSKLASHNAKTGEPGGLS
jgi:hypothetical protein